MPVPICCASASSAERRPSAISRSAKPSGNDVRDLLAEQLVAAVAELFLRLHVQQDDLAALVHHHHRVRVPPPAVRGSGPPSAPDGFSASLRTLMSRIAAVTRMPSALSSGLSIISIGNSLPSFRRAMSSMPVPICCASASAAERSPSAISRSAKPSE